MDCFRVFNLALLKATKDREALLSEVRYRSKSFTEGRTTNTDQESLPSVHPHLPSPHPGWSSSPVSPRDSQHDDPDDVIDSGRHLLRHGDVGETGDVGSPRDASRGVLDGVRHPRQRVVCGDDSVDGVTSDSRDVIPDVGVNHRDFGGGEGLSRGNDVRYYDGIGDDVGGREDDEKRVQVSLNHSRTYSAAWDEYDGEEESRTQDNHHSSSSPRETLKSAPENGVADGTWSSTTPDSGFAPGQKTDEATARSNTIPRHRPATLFSAHSQTTVFSSRQGPELQVAASANEEQLARFSSSETLGRQPRGPILRYFQRAREADRSPSVSPRAFSLDSPRESTFIFPGELTSSSSAIGEHTSQKSSEPHSFTSASSDVVRSSTDSSQASGQQDPANIFTGSIHKSSSKVPHPHKKSSSIPLRARSSSQGPPQSQRRTPSAIPISSARHSSTSGPMQNPRGGSSGIPIRPRSSSTGPNYAFRKPLGKASERSRTREAGVKGKKGEGGRVAQPIAVMELAAKDLMSPSMHGFLCRKTFSDQWVRYWYLLQEDCLYCYLTPDDHVTVDVTDLDGYSVTSLEDKFPGQRFVLHLEHEDYIAVYLSASSREEMEEWHAVLTSAIKVIPRVNGLHHPHQQQQEEGEGARAALTGEDRAQGIKQKLLAEVLRQTQELEKKQAARLATKHKQFSLDVSDSHSPPSSPSSLIPTGQQICTLTRLRQRRMSTQIKMDTLQRQMQSNCPQGKKSRFTFGKKKSVEDPQSPQNPDLVQQLKTLSDHLSAIDRDLMQNGGVMSLDRKSTPAAMLRGWKVISRHSQDPESAVLERGGSGGGGGGGIKSGLEGVVNEDGSIGRNNSLKSSVQKLAHRTFAKAGWYRNKKTSQEGSFERDDSSVVDKPEDHHNNNNSDDTPDVIDLSRRLMRTWPARDVSQESEDGAELFLPPPSSFDGADTPSPVSSPRSAGSASSERVGSRSGSLLRSEESRIPRRQVDPDAMANIEAFEEMSRQILGEPT